MTPADAQNLIEELAQIFDFHLLNVCVNGQWLIGIPCQTRLTDLETYMKGMGLPFTLATYEAYRPRLVANAGLFGFIVPDKSVAVTGKAYIIAH